MVQCLTFQSFTCKRFIIGKSAAAALAALGTLLAPGAAAWAQSYPTKPLTIVVPFAAGGPTDRTARDLAEALRKPLGGASVLVENVAGGGGSIGPAKVARAEPDGYTLLVAHIGMATMPTLQRKLSFSVENDFEYLGMVNDVPMTVVGRPTLPAKNYKELIAWLGDNKGKINLGNAGIGSAAHLCGMMFQNAVQVDMTTVSYRGTGPAMVDLMGGQIDLLCDQTINTSPQIEANKVIAYAVTTSRRIATPVLKDLPTLQESGLKGFEVTIWHALYGPKGLPADVARKLSVALKAALKDPEFIKKQEALGALVVTDKRVEPQEHKRFVAAEIAKWSPVIKAAGVYAD